MKEASAALALPEARSPGALRSGARGPAPKAEGQAPLKVPAALTGVAGARVDPGCIAELGMKVPALAGLVCEAIDDARAAFDEAREDLGAESREKVKRIALRLDRLIRWTEKVRKLTAEVSPAGARIGPPLAERLQIGLWIVVQMVSDGIDDLQEALQDRASRPGLAGHIVCRLDRAIRWAVRLRKLVAGAKPEGARLPGGVLRRLEGKLPTLVAFVCAAVDDLSSAYEGARPSTSSRNALQFIEGREPAVIDSVMSRLDRMLRWVERIRKLVAETKPLETKRPETKGAEAPACAVPGRYVGLRPGPTNVPGTADRRPPAAEGREEPGARSGRLPADTRADGPSPRRPAGTDFGELSRAEPLRGVPRGFGPAGGRPSMSSSMSPGTSDVGELGRAAGPVEPPACAPAVRKNGEQPRAAGRSPAQATTDRRPEPSPRAPGDEAP